MQCDYGYKWTCSKTASCSLGYTVEGTVRGYVHSNPLYAGALAERGKCQMIPQYDAIYMDKWTC